MDLLLINRIKVQNFFTRFDLNQGPHDYQSIVYSSMRFTADTCRASGISYDLAVCNPNQLNGLENTLIQNLQINEEVLVFFETEAEISSSSI